MKHTINIAKLPEHAKSFFREYFALHPAKGGNPEMNKLRRAFKREEFKDHPDTPPCMGCAGNIIKHDRSCIAYND